MQDKCYHQHKPAPMEHNTLPICSVSLATLLIKPSLQQFKSWLQINKTITTV